MCKLPTKSVEVSFDGLLREKGKSFFVCYSSKKHTLQVCALTKAISPQFGFKQSHLYCGVRFFTRSTQRHLVTISASGKKQCNSTQKKSQ